MKRLFNWFKTLSHIQQIAIWVCFTHISLGLALFIQDVTSKSFKPTRPMIVRVVPPAPIPLNANHPSAPQSKPNKSPPKPTSPTPVPKKPIQNPTPSKPKTTPSPAATPHPTPSPEPTPRPKPSLAIPSKITPKQEPLPKQINEPSTEEFLVAYLQSALELPEYGEVRAKIEIDTSGTLISCEILDAKSRKNSDFLKNRLPELVFPCLNHSQSFTITFKNADIH